MAKKKKTEKPQREMTRRHLALWQREKRRQRIIFVAGIAIIAIVILTVIGGWYASEYRPLHQTVIRVYDTKFDMSYFVHALKFYARTQPSDSTQTQAQYLTSNADSLIGEIEQDELIKLGAASQNITISNDDVRKRLENAGIEVDAASIDLLRSQMLHDQILNEYFDSQVPKTAAQAHILVMLLESESQAAEVRSRLLNSDNASDNFTNLAAKLSLDEYSKAYNGDIGWHPQEIFKAMLGSSVPGDYALGSEAGTLSQPRYDADITKNFGYWLVKILDKPEGATTAQVQLMLLVSQQEAQDLRAKIEGGEDFATLAKELSQDEESKESGGEKTVAVGQPSPALEAYIFSSDTKTGALSDPIRDDSVTTKGAYWLIKVEEKESDRPLTTDDRNYLLEKAYYNWVSSLWVTAGTNVDDSYLDIEKKAWAVEEAVSG